MFNDFNLEIFLNFASFIAILIIFRKEVWELIVGFFDYLFKKNKKAKDLFNYCLLIIVGTIPVGLLGLVFKEPLENLLYKNVFLVGVGFLLTAVSLIVVMNSDGKKEDKDLTVKDALIVGLIQAIDDSTSEAAADSAAVVMPPVQLSPLPSQNARNIQTAAVAARERIMECQ